MTNLAPKTLLLTTLDADTGGLVAAWGILSLRAGTGALIFYVHGWHKLEGGLDFMRHGTPWPLAQEVAGMHFPAPLVSAFTATAGQFLLAPMLAVGLFTRVSAAILTAVLGVAVWQNLLAGRDPQLAVLYTLVVAAFILIGGGRLSIDARLDARANRQGDRVISDC